MSQVSGNSTQGVKLIEFLRDNLAGDGFLLTQQGDDVYVSTGLASATISADGEVDEA